METATAEEGDVQVFTFNQILQMTGNLRREGSLGSGGFGNVYRGQLPDTGQVAYLHHMNDFHI